MVWYRYSTEELVGWWEEGQRKMSAWLEGRGRRKRAWVDALEKELVLCYGAGGRSDQ